MTTALRVEKVAATHGQWQPSGCSVAATAFPLLLGDRHSERAQRARNLEQIPVIGNEARNLELLIKESVGFNCA